MNTHRIAVIAGDGIGPEVISEGVKVLNAVAAKEGTFAFDFTYFPWGCEYYLREGRMMPKDALETLKRFDAIFLGAVGYPGVPDHISLRDLLLEIRHGFDQYVNVRPVKLLKGAPCPLAGVKREDIDMTFIPRTPKASTRGPASGVARGRRKRPLSSMVSLRGRGVSASCAMPTNLRGRRRKP